MNIQDNKDFQELVKLVGEEVSFSPVKAQELINRIRETVKVYIIENKLKALIVGVSGGLDSAIICAILQEKYTSVPLIGISIPLSSSNEHMEQAEWVGNKYCSVFEEFNEWEEDYYTRETIENKVYESTPLYKRLFDVLERTDSIAEKAGFKVNDFPKSVLQGNMKARIRMLTLYDLARKVEGMVLSTDNLSEFRMGFWTINGDVGDYGAIQNIGKGFELPIIAKALNIREDIITQPPSDGLMVTEANTDEQQLGANYKEVDTIMYCMEKANENFTKFSKTEIGKLYLDLFNKNQEKIWDVTTRYNAMAYKRKGTINLSREEIGL